MKTPSEARECWCPFYRMTAGINAEGTAEWHDNREDKLGVTRCIAEECMAWRWVHGKARENWHDGDKGFCGLAGKP